MNRRFRLSTLLYVSAFSLIANGYLLLRACPAVLIVLLPIFCSSIFSPVRGGTKLPAFG